MGEQHRLFPRRYETRLVPSMTIQFNCPNCDALIAFNSKHCGRRAKCLTCGQVFIIPSRDYEKPQTVEPQHEKPEPEPGFYRAISVDSWKIFFNPENITSLAFVVAVICFQFFLTRTFCCGWPIFFVAWGWLLGFYLNIIYDTAFGIDRLPEIYLGTSITFLWYAVKPFLVFLFTMFIVEMPFIITLSLLQDKGITYSNMWTSHSGYFLLLQVLYVAGLFFFPMAILITAVAQDITMLTPSYIIAPIFRAFIPYTLIFALLAAACILEMWTTYYDPSAKAAVTSITARLGFNLAVQVVAIIAMRSIGLFYRHYTCRFKW